MKKIVILTGNELRHNFFRTFLGSSREINVLKTFCESAATLEEKVNKESESEARSTHLKQRTETEVDFFQAFVQRVPDSSNPLVIPKGEINSEVHVREIIRLNPDFIVSYGCSIIKSELIQHFENRFINVHLGLSPYYRGSGTNFWPFVNGEPEFIGVTFMHIDSGIDTGKIIHQIRARIHPWDSMHTIGNRLIADAAETCESLLIHSGSLEEIPEGYFPELAEKYYRNKDFDEQSVNQAYENFAKGMLPAYLDTLEERQAKSPIFSNPGLSQQAS